MYLAELRGKFPSSLEFREDILTSNVFSFFKYSDRETFLKPFLAELGFLVSKEEAKNAEFLFWPNYDDRTQPDVVIIIGKYYLLVEAKYFSDFGKESGKTKAQLIREIEGGQMEAENEGLEFSLIAVTREYSKPGHKFDTVPASINFKWINWQTVSSFLYLKLQDKLTPNYQFAEDLYLLLVKKNLRVFKAFLDVLPVKNLQKTELVFFDCKTALHRGVFIGFLELFGDLTQVMEKHRNIFYASETNFFEVAHRGSITKSDKEIFWGGQS